MLPRPVLSPRLDWTLNAHNPPPAMTLTASDGAGLALRAVDVKVHVQDPLVFTEMTLVFYNPEPREREGRFSITLPSGAAVSRFAMRIRGDWQEGEVVEKQRARRIYEDILHRRQDPALLEKTPGNRFDARVYPIAPNSEKALIISWSHTLSSAQTPVRLPFAGLPQLETFQARVSVETWDPNQPTAVFIENERPAGADLEVILEGEPWDVGLKNGDLAVARIRPLLRLPQPTMPRGVTIFLDTSASQALNFADRLERLAELIGALGGRGVQMLELFAFDQEVVSVYDGPISGFGQVQLERLRERGALGASDFAQALQKAQAGQHERLVFITDGLPTAGAVTLDRLQPALAEATATRIDALIEGGIRDETLLLGLVRGTLEEDGVLLEADIDVEEIVERLGQGTRSGIGVSVPGARWCWPTVLDGLQPGDEVLIYAEMEDPDAPMEVRLDGAWLEQGVSAATVPRPLLARSVAQASIERLSKEASENPDQRKTINAEIVRISTAHRVLSDLTALLVLETQADYTRYGLDREALAEILTVQDDQLILMERQPLVFPDPPPTPTPRKADKAAKKKRARARRAAPVERERGISAPSEVFEEASAGAGMEADISVDAMASLSMDEDDNGDFGDEDLMRESAMDLSDLEEAEEEMAVGASPALAARMSAPSPVPSADIPAPQAAPMPSLQRSQVMDADVPPPMAEEASRPPGLLGRIRERAEALFSRRSPSTPDASVEDSSTGVRGTGSRVVAVPKAEGPGPWSGRYATVQAHLSAGRVEAALTEARAWRAASPGDVVALLALGECLEAAGQTTEAVRAYGAIIDLFSGRADLRRMAAERLERLSDGLALAADSYAKAAEQRPTHASGRRLLAYALHLRGEHQAAVEEMIAAIAQEYPIQRPGVDRVMREDLGLLGAAWSHAAPDRHAEIRETVIAAGGDWPQGPSTRLVLSWETDANDVDLHVYDSVGGHAFYSSKQLSSGGELYADVTNGYGPECFTFPGTPSAGPYTFRAHYYSCGPMGYGMGVLHIIRHDGAGALDIEARPFVLMVDRAWVPLGTMN